MFENINEVSVLVSAILAVAVGSVWYSPVLFGGIWGKSLGNPSWLQNEDRKSLIASAVKGVLVYIVIFFTLAKLILISDEVESVSLLGLVSIILVLIWSFILNPVIWEKKPLSYFFVHAGYFAVVLLGGLGVISNWPW